MILDSIIPSNTRCRYRGKPTVDRGWLIETRMIWMCWPWPHCQFGGKRVYLCTYNSKQFDPFASKLTNHTLAFGAIAQSPGFLEASYGYVWPLFICKTILSGLHKFHILGTLCFLPFHLPLHIISVGRSVWTKTHRIMSLVSMTMFWGSVSLSVNKSKVKLRLLYCHPPQLRSATLGLWDSLNCFAIITQPIALMSVAACQASGRLCLFT